MNVAAEYRGTVALRQDDSYENEGRQQLLLLDLNLPKTTGRSVLAEREKDPILKVFQSAHPKRRRRVPVTRRTPRPQSGNRSMYWSSR